MIDIKKRLNRGKTIIYEYLKRLEYWGILMSSKEGHHKIWAINPKLKMKGG